MYMSFALEVAIVTLIKLGICVGGGIRHLCATLWKSATRAVAHPNSKARSSNQTKPHGHRVENKVWCNI